MATTQIRISPADHGRRTTVEEFRDAEEEPGYRYELARGVLEVTEIPNDPHGQIEDNLREAIGEYRRTHPGLIRRCGGAGVFRLWGPEMVSGRNPDQAFVLEGVPQAERGATAIVGGRGRLRRKEGPGPRLCRQARGISPLRPPRILDRRPLD